MIIKNAEVFTEEGVFEKKDIYIQNGVFVENAPEDDQVIDATGCYAIPGLSMQCCQRMELLPRSTAPRYAIREDF